jgi:methionyl-tRNA formyltransferase
MKVIFAGTPEFAAIALAAIIEAGHDVVAVLTQPDRRAGRGMQLQASPVKEIAQKKNIRIFQPLSLNIEAIDLDKRNSAYVCLEELNRIKFDVVVVVAYGLMLPREFLQMAKQSNRLGCFNIHASLLPRWRGAAPIQRAIEAGDTKTGVAIMEMDIGLDTGPVLIQEAIEISPNETSKTLHDRLAALGAKLITKALKIIGETPKLTLIAQSVEGVTYANKILKAESAIDWGTNAVSIDRKVRALNPTPGASTELNGDLIKVWLTRPISEGVYANKEVRPGTILGEGTDGVLVQCADRALEILELQKAGGKKMSGRSWFLSNVSIKGKQFTNPSNAG